MLILIQNLRRTAIAAFAALVCSGALNAPEASAASATWNNSAGNAWISTTNWNVSGTYPGALGSGTNTDTAVISGTAISGNGLGLNLSTPTNNTFSVGGVLWNYTTASGSIGNSSTTASGTLRLNGGSFNVGNTGGTINNLFFAIGDSATKDLTVSNTAAGGDKSMTVLLNNTSGTMYVTSGRLLSVRVPLIEPAGTPTGFTKVGSGTLSLGAANTLTGTVALNGGALALNNASALGTGTLALGASATQVSITSANIDINRPVTVAGGGGGTSGEGLIHFTPSTGSGTWSGNITVNGAPTAGGVFGTGGGELVLSGTVRANNSILTVRTGVVTLSNTGNVFSQIIVNDGTLKIGAVNAVPVSGSIGLSNNYALDATLNLNGFNQSAGLIFGSGSTATIKNDGASRKTLTITGTTPSSGVPYTVISRSGTSATTMTFQDGTGGMDLVFSTGTNVPVIDNTAAILISSSLTSASGFLKTGTGTLTLSASNGALLAGTITGSAGTLSARTPGALGTGTVALAGSTLTFAITGGTYTNPITTATTSQITANNIGVTLSGPITLAGDVTFRGQGGDNNKFTLSNANAITSANNSNVTFNLDDTQNHVVSGIISIGTGAVSKASSATLTLSNGANSFSGGLNQNGSGGITISAAGAQGSGTITFGSGGTGAITFSNVDGTVANNIVSTGGSGGITKSGTGSTLTLTGNNTYTGATTVSGGYIRVANSNALSATSLVSLSANNANPGGIQLDPGIVVNRLIQTAGRNNPTTTGYVLRSLGGSTEWQGNIEINSTGGNYAFLSDSGTMTLSGTLTSIATGTSGRRGVQFAGDGDFAVTGNIVKGGTLAVQDMFVRKFGAGTLTLSGSNDFSGGTTVGGTTVSTGTLRAGHVSAFGSGTVTVGTGGTLDLAGRAIANPLAVTGGSVTNASAYAGTQTLSGAVSYAGSVGGTLDVAAGGLLKGSNVTFTGPVSITGTHSPGSSPGLQTFTSGLGYTSAATLVWELSANTALAIDRGSLYDAIDTTTGGTLSIDPAATISLVFNAALADSTASTVDWNNAFWANDRQWKVIDVLAPVTWNQVTFANVLVGNDATGASLASKRPQGSFTVGASGGDLYVFYVPEPVLTGFAPVGLSLLVLRRRRR